MSNKAPTPAEYLEYLTATEDMLKAQLKVIEHQKKLAEMAVKTSEFMSNPFSFFLGAQNNGKM